ncbi:tyrosine-protein phosphatase required for protection against superoxide stress (By similarity) [Orbilia brochopaga]|uniref:Putative tyrosine-protein phosphatase OCA1 n=1 Tax=Orbilia brochopaga TaxID=3140254 RepID=A0AAV9TZ30_9PEZI
MMASTSQHTLSKLVPPLNFACVEEGLFRSAGPLALNLPFISELALNTVIWMAKEDPSPEFLQLAEEKGIKVLNFGIPEITTAWEPEVEKNTSGALQAIADASNGRILVSCTMGRHRTGTVIGCFRRLQNWSTASTFAEYRRFTGSQKYRVINELHIETFNRASIQLPEGDKRQPWLRDIDI